MDWRKGYADVAFGQMHYSIHRRAASGQGSALILLNSRARSSLALMPLFPDIEQVVSIDLPGFGLSSPVRDGAAMHDVAHGVVDCMTAIGIGRAHVFGLHTGHKVAAAVSSAWPNRVDRFVVAGRSHSLIPDHMRRNQAMQAVIDENQLDMSILRMEGQYADERAAPRAFANIFKANFAFDFAAAMRDIQAPTMVIEITSESEDGKYGRQGDQLIAGMTDARAVVLPMTDPTGLLLYIGVELMAESIRAFLGRA